MAMASKVRLRNYTSTLGQALRANAPCSVVIGRVRPLEDRGSPSVLFAKRGPATEATRLWQQSRWSEAGQASWRTGSAAAAAAAAVLALASSSAACESVQRVKLGNAADFEDGTMTEVQLDSEGGGASVLLHRHAGKFYATAAACSHYGAPLKKGISSAGGRGGPPCVTCPLHDAAFDLETGQVVRGPGLDGIAAYKTEVDKGTVYAYVPRSVVGGAKPALVQKQMARRDKKMKDQRVFALLGGGPASLAAAETLRQEGFGGRIVILSKEPHLPYDRVQLSKALDKPVEKLLLRNADFFQKHDIEIVHGAVVTKLDTKTNEVRYRLGGGEQGPAVGAEGSELALKYDSVLVATGGSPRKLFVPGSHLPGIFTLRTPEDARAITEHAKRGLKIVVVGGSFIGMEVASTLRKMGCQVSVVALETVPFERVLGKKIGATFARVLQKEGVEWFGSSQVRLFRGDEKVNGVELEDGEVLAADAVVVGAGVLPNTRFLEGVTLDKNGAIIVNPLLASDSAPNVFAAGDVCAYPSVRTGTRVRIEHWDVATQQGRVAARNMLGQYQPFTTTPFFWSSLFGHSLRFVGYAPDVLDRVIIEGDAAGLEFISYYTEDDEIRAVATVGRDPIAAACAELMRRGQMPRASELIIGTVNADVILNRLKALSQAK